jgi:hypothetical protein
MRIHLPTRLLLLVVALAALTAAYQSARIEEAMAETAMRFIQALPAEQKPKVVFEFADKDRMNWHFFPDPGYTDEYGHDRRGLGYKYMDDRQQRLASALVSSGLSPAGFSKAMSVMTLEDILRVIEKDTTGYRDIGKYYVSIFGQPSAVGTWGWKLEGHHLALNYTIKDGKLVSTSPTFFGANPHHVREGPHKGMRALGREEDAARALVKSLNPKQRQEAILYDVAYEDILTLADIRAKLDNEPLGLPASKLNTQQYEMLSAVVAEYANNMPAEVAAGRMKAFQDAPRDKVFFVWTGSVEPGKGDYYRVQTPTFLIEYDNTQHGNNHSHSVWRDFNGDFGMDVLAAHHRAFPHGLSRIHHAD